ncbi:MAG: AAA family ATPase, partial [Planctomycetes bacterium]|nr:AAA family ATPase [Planctomycetota bacterium]
MRMVLLGPPGSDKGEYATKVAKRCHVVLLSVAGMLSEAVERRLDAGIQAQAYLERGQYVPDEILFEVIRDRMTRPDVQAGFLLVGFPRSSAQADTLDEILGRSRMTLDLALHLDVEEEVLLERLEGRRTCVSCGTRYNIFSNPPLVH